MLDIRGSVCVRVCLLLCVQKRKIIYYSFLSKEERHMELDGVVLLVYMGGIRLEGKGG